MSSSNTNNNNQNALFFGLAGLAGVVKKTILSGFASSTTSSMYYSKHLTQFEEPPEHLKCVITQDLFEDPVVLLQTGYTYEREAISRWLRSKRFGNQPTDPTTNAIVTCTDVVPNWQIRAGVEAWLQEKGYGASEYFQKRMYDNNDEDVNEDDSDENNDGKGEEEKKKQKQKYTTTLPPPKWPLVRCASGAPPATGEPTDKYGVPVGGRDGRGGRSSSSSSRNNVSRLTALAERMHNALHRDVIVIFHALKRIALSSPRNLSFFLASFGAAVGGILVAFLIVVQRILFLLTGRVSAAGLEPSAALTAASSDEQVRAYINENAANSVATAIGNILWWTFILTMMWFTQHNAIHEHQQAHLMRARAAQAQAEGNQRRQGHHRYWHWGQRHPRFLHW